MAAAAIIHTIFPHLADTRLFISPPARGGALAEQPADCQAATTPQPETARDHFDVGGVSAAELTMHTVHSMPAYVPRVGQVCQAEQQRKDSEAFRCPNNTLYGLL